MHTTKSTASNKAKNTTSKNSKPIVNQPKLLPKEIEFNELKAKLSTIKAKEEEKSDVSSPFGKQTPSYLHFIQFSLRFY